MQKNELAQQKFSKKTDRILVHKRLIILNTDLKKENIEKIIFYMQS